MGRSNSRKRRHEENPSEQKQQQPPQQKPPKSLKSTGLSGVFSDLKPEKKQTTRIPVQPAPNDDCPNTWKGLVGNYQSHQFMKRLSSLKSLNGNVWVVWGATGAGKSSAVYLACKSKMWMHTLRAIGEPYLDRLDKFVRASRRHFKREVVVIDPLEEIIRGPSCVKRLCGIMRMAQERSTGLGFFIVCDDIYHKSLWPLRNNREMKQLTTKVLRFWPLRPDNIKKILIRHGVSTKARLEEGITISDGDGRRAVKFAKNGSHAGDRTINRFQACEALAEGRVRDVYRVDAPAPFLRFVTLNAPNMVGGDMDLCARMADVASDGDCMGRNGVHMDMLVHVRGLQKIPRGKTLHRDGDDPQRRAHVKRMSRMFGCSPLDLPDRIRQVQNEVHSDPFKVRAMRGLSEAFQKWDVPASLAHDIATRPRFSEPSCVGE